MDKADLLVICYTYQSDNRYKKLVDIGASNTWIFIANLSGKCSVYVHSCNYTYVVTYHTYRFQILHTQFQFPAAYLRIRNYTYV